MLRPYTRLSSTGRYDLWTRGGIEGKPMLWARASNPMYLGVKFNSQPRLNEYLQTSNAFNHLNLRYRPAR